MMLVCCCVKKIEKIIVFCQTKSLSQLDFNPPCDDPFSNKISTNMIGLTAVGEKSHQFDWPRKRDRKVG